MLGALISVLVLALITAAMAAVLVVADRFLNDYGDCEITINDEKELTVEGGGSLLESLAENEIFIPSACGGRGTCAYCKVRVLNGGGPVVPTEEPYLEDDELEDGMRLSCQVKVKEAIDIEIPAEYLSIKSYRCKCEHIRELTADIKEFRLALIEPGEIDFTPGQYVQLQSEEYDGNDEVYRAYSIASDPADPSVIDLVIQLIPGGICTTWCFEHLSEDDEVTFNGPYGDFKLTDNDASLVFIAGASGMAPIKCFLHHLQNTDDDREATFFFGANRVDQLFYREEMQEFEKELPNFTFVPVVAEPEDDDKWEGETGLVTEAVERHLDNDSDCEAYLCGSPGMIDAAVEVLTDKGVKEDCIFYDKFD